MLVLSWPVGHVGFVLECGSDSLQVCCSAVTVIISGLA